MARVSLGENPIRAQRTGVSKTRPQPRSHVIEGEFDKLFPKGKTAMCTEVRAASWVESNSPWRTQHMTIARAHLVDVSVTRWYTRRSHAGLYDAAPQRGLG